MNIPKDYEPFSYEEALKRPGDVIYRDGTVAKIIAYSPTASAARRIITMCDQGEFYMHYQGGHLFLKKENDADLFLRAPAVTIFRNDYGPDDDLGFGYSSLEEAIERARHDCIHVLAFTYRDGKLIGNPEIVHTYS